MENSNRKPNKIIIVKPSTTTDYSCKQNRYPHLQSTNMLKTNFAFSTDYHLVFKVPLGALPKKTQARKVLFKLSFQPFNLFILNTYKPLGTPPYIDDW